MAGAGAEVEEKTEGVWRHSSNTRTRSSSNLNNSNRNNSKRNK